MLAKKYKKGNRVSKKYDPVLGKITKIGKHGDNFKVIFKNPDPKQEPPNGFLLKIWLTFEKNQRKGRLKH